MKIILFIVICFSILSCKKESGPQEGHNPYKQINQNIENKKAIKLYNEGNDSYLKGDFKSATNSLNKSFEIEKSPITLNELGVIEVAKKDYYKAIYYFNQGKKLDSLYWPTYINEARSFLILEKFDEAESLLLELKEICQSDYWIAYTDFFLAIVYFNSKDDCEKIKKHIEKSKILISDPDLKDKYLKIKNTVERNCG